MTNRIESRMYKNVIMFISIAVAMVVITIAKKAVAAPQPHPNKVEIQNQIKSDLTGFKFYLNYN
jgi:hypothetical protein